MTGTRTRTVDAHRARQALTTGVGQDLPDPGLMDLLAAGQLHRARTVRAWARAAHTAFGVGVLADWDPGRGCWDVAWDSWQTGAPTTDQVREHLNTYPGMANHLDTVNLQAPCPAALWWARAMLRPGAAVIVDTETTGLIDPDVIEIAVIDAATGHTLLDTLVQTTTVIDAAAHAVHQISTADLAGAPTWQQVLPRLLHATSRRTLIAYNAGFDAHAITSTTSRHPHLHAQHLADPTTWACLMGATQDRWRHLRPGPLNGGHRALSDCHAARELLQKLAYHHDLPH